MNKNARANLIFICLKFLLADMLLIVFKSFSLCHIINNTTVFRFITHLQQVSGLFLYKKNSEIFFGPTVLPFTLHDLADIYRLSKQYFLDA